MQKRVNPIGIAVLVFAVVLVTLTSIRLTGMSSKFPNPVGNALDRILSPVERVIWNIGDGIKDNFRAIFSFRVVEAENKDLEQEVERLKGDNLVLKQQVLAALRYRELDDGVFKSPSIQKYSKIGATIVNRNPSAWYQTISVNKGSNDGIKMDDPVIASNGLVGKVVSVSSENSDILLILDLECQVGALVRDNQGKAIFGVLKGSSQKGARTEVSGRLEMDFRLEDEVNRGDLVFSSGLGGVYPKDIPIGLVDSVKIDTNGLLKTAEIKPVVDLDSLEEVYIIAMPEAG